MIDCFPLSREQASLEALFWESWYFPSQMKPYEITLQISARHCEIVLSSEASIRFYNEAQEHYLGLIYQGLQGFQLSQEFNKFLACLSDQYLRVPAL